MRQYKELLESILKNGVVRNDRTGVGTISTFGNMLKFNLREGFPIVTMKETWFKGCKYELKWFLEGGTNIKYLQDNKVRIWDPWADENGDLGPVYGSQWRNWGGRGIDQLSNALETIRMNPDSRRIVVSAWNPADLDKMALPPCHMFFQFYVDREYLDIMVYQRSADMFLGVPFDIAEYALLLEITAQCSGKTARNMTYVFGDTHIYLNHIEKVEELLKREPRKLPKLVFLDDLCEYSDYDPEKVILDRYNPWPAIKASVAV